MCLADNIAELGRCAQRAALDGLLAATAYEALACETGDIFARGCLEPTLTRLSFGGTPSSPGSAAETAGAQRVSRSGRPAGAGEWCECAIWPPDESVAVDMCRARE